MAIDTVDALHRLTDHAWDETRVRSSVSGEASHALLESLPNARPLRISEVLRHGAVAAAPAPAPAVLPATLDLQTGPINFPGGTPVRGWANLRLYQNGNYEFWGHFHDSGAPSYDAGLAWVLVGQDGHALTFARKVHMNGTFESGSRDGDFDDHGNNPDITAHWAALNAQWHYRWSAKVNWDWGIIVKQVEDAIKAAGTIISSVTPIVALL